MEISRVHDFSDLIELSTNMTLRALREVQARATVALESSASSSLVKELQAIRLQKTIFAVGMISLFEARLQAVLGCDNGFAVTDDILVAAGEQVLFRRLADLKLATNALKHGRGRSYDQLSSRAPQFAVKRPGQSFFFEGDVSEIATLVEVDDAFIEECAAVIREVSEAIARARPTIVP